MKEPMSENPSEEIDVRRVFGIDLPWPVHGFSESDEHVPVSEESFRFVPSATRAVLAGFMHNRRVYLSGPHGSGKSSHIEQVAARLNWPCVRVNLDGHITRADLIGRDMVVLRDGKQVTEFVPGILVWALERPVALVLDEYDAGRPDVMFVIQRVLEAEGKLTLLDQNRVISPHPAFRLFATANTAGQGDASGIYVGTQALNQAQMDRWQIVEELGYLPADQELEIVRAHVSDLGDDTLRGMIAMAGLCREACRQGDLSTLMSLRTLLTWADNERVMESVDDAFRTAFFNRCDETERSTVAELYQRCFGRDLPHDAQVESTY